jgi:hypothetical protein
MNNLKKGKKIKKKRGGEMTQELYAHMNNKIIKI